MSYNAYEEKFYQKTGSVCPDGRIKYTYQRGAGPSFEKITECLEPTSQADCPSGFEFVQIPRDVNTDITAIGGIAGVYPFDRRCRKIQKMPGEPMTGSKFAPDVATPTETAAPTAKNYFWLYAIAVGVGIYILTRSKTKI